MRDVYIFEYLNEAEFKKRERSVKKYNMFAFKKLIFDFYPEMKEGNFLGNVVGEDKENKVHRLLDYSNNPRDIADPWYTGNFDETYNDIMEGLEAFLKYLNL